MAEGTKGGSIPWTPANVVTCIRIVMIPVLIVAMLAPWGSAASKPWVCMALFALISLTDSLDGYLARSRNEVTTFGKFMDPIADKLLVVSALTVLVQTSGLPSWVPIVIVVRELLVSGLRMLAASAGVVIAASYFGKAKTLCTMVAICVFMVKDAAQLASVAGIANTIAWFLMIVAIILTIVSMIDYFAKSRTLFTNDEPGAHVTTTPAVAGQGATRPGSVPAERSDLAALHAQIERLAAEVVASAAAAHVTIGTAESLTGGLISGAITSVPGSSEVIAGGVTSYMARVKESVLGVSHETITDHGVVSEQTAEQMASGGRARLDVDHCVAVTGVAGPGGGTSETPVGTVCFGMASRDGATATITRHFAGDREQVRLQTVLCALEMLRDALA